MKCCHVRLRTAEIADRNRRIYLDTPPTDSPSGNEAIDGWESTSGSRHSRSRSREHTQHEAEKDNEPSTLDRKVLQDITNITQDPKVDTSSQSHVLDLWCTDLTAEDRKDPIVLDLDSLLTPGGNKTAVHLWVIQDATVNSLFLEIEGPPTSASIEQELVHWGRTPEVIKMDEKHPAAEYLVRSAGTGPTCLYYNPEDSLIPIVAPLKPSTDEIIHMRRLCDFGFCRAVILDSTKMSEDAQLVRFHDSATATFQEDTNRPIPSLPPRMQARDNRPYGHLLTPSLQGIDVTPSNCIPFSNR